jgi:hypothetical protein
MRVIPSKGTSIPEQGYEYSEQRYEYSEQRYEYSGARVRVFPSKGTSIRVFRAGRGTSIPTTWTLSNSGVEWIQPRYTLKFTATPCRITARQCCGATTPHDGATTPPHDVATTLRCVATGPYQTARRSDKSVCVHGRAHRQAPLTQAAACVRCQPFFRTCQKVKKTMALTDANL